MIKKVFTTPAGMTGYISATVWLLFVALSLILFWRKRWDGKIIDVKFLLFILGSTVPLLDDLLAFYPGAPFSHHSLFHSLLGVVLVFILVQFIFRIPNTKYLIFGHSTHIFFNFIIDYVSLFYPFTVNEFSFSQLLPLSSAEVKIFLYPTIILLFLRANYIYLKDYTRYAKQ